MATTNTSKDGDDGEDLSPRERWEVGLQNIGQAAGAFLGQRSPSGKPDQAGSEVRLVYGGITAGIAGARLIMSGMDDFVAAAKANERAWADAARTTKWCGIAGVILAGVVAVSTAVYAWTSWQMMVPRGGP